MANFINIVIYCLTTNYMNFSGRASRSEFWFFMLFLFLLYGVAFPVLEVIGALIPGALAIVAIVFFCASAALILPTLGAHVRRLHDINWRGWWLLLSFTFLGTVFILILECLPGTAGVNRFGPNPLDVRPRLTGPDLSKRQ